MRKSERTRQFIIETAAPIFNSQGVAGTAISDIMDATKLAKGGLYGNFDSKEEIMLASFDHISEKIKQALAGVTAPHTVMKDKLEALFVFYSKYALQPIVQGGCPILNFGTEADDANPELRQRVSKLITYFQQRIVQMVTIGIERKEFRKNWDPQRFAVKMFTMIEGAVLVCRIQRSNRQMKMIIDMLREEMQAHCL